MLKTPLALSKDNTPPQHKIKIHLQTIIQQVHTKLKRMTKAKTEIIVKGKIQKVGYRDLVQEIARSLNVKGYVENQKDDSVHIMCETDENTLKNFIKQINIKRSKNPTARKCIT
jgi:acylphosphatase